MNNKIIFQIRDISNHFSLSHTASSELYGTHVSSQNLTKQSYSSNIDVHPHFLFLSELLHSPLYYTLSATSTRVLVFTVHPRVFPLEVFFFFAIIIFLFVFI
jgi:hypothetical protein